MTPTDVEQFVAGVIYGLIQKNDFADIKTCLANAETIGKEAEEAIVDFSKLSEQGIIDGAEVVFHIVEELPQDLKNCKNMAVDMERIARWTARFASPTVLILTITKNVALRLVGLIKDAKKVVHDWDVKDYYNTGDDVADILVKILGKVPALGEEEELPDLDPESIPFTTWG